MVRYPPMRLELRLACAIGIGLAAVARLGAAAPASPQQQIALIAKPAVVRVWGAYLATYKIRNNQFKESIGGSGTGFFITADGYIATNAHVVASVADGEIKAKEALARALFTELDRRYHADLEKLNK